MSKRILIEHRDGAREIALMNENRLLYFTRESSGVQAEQIYLAVADRMVKGMEAAFVRLPGGQTGFLPFAECREKPASGDRLLLQVKKPPVGEKAPYMTADIALAGRYAILTPRKAECGVSKKITDEAARARLYETARRLAPAGMGLVMRTESAAAPEEALQAEIAALAQRWRDIRGQASAGAAPCLIRDREDTLSRLLRDEHGQIEEILTDAPERAAGLGLPVRSCENPFALYRVRAQWEKANQRKVWLDCGGFLVTDRTEALTVIDVNSGKFTGGKTGAEQTFLRLNLEAAREIARLMRLRRMGGIILVDFVDMQKEESREQVLAAMAEALRDDPVKTALHGFTHLGLLEMTRKKTEAPQ